MEDNQLSEKIGDVLGNLLGALITIGATGGILFFCWNWGLHQILDVNEIKYYQSLYLILGWRAMTYQTNK
jgi:hypothetical protein